MQELVGRLTALDAEATESLKVISYFDALVDGHAHVEVLLRGAAILSGCAAGFSADGRVLRVDTAGTPAPGEPGHWPSHTFGDGGLAWIERDGAAHANDDMILERLAIALGIAVDRTSPTAALRRALETLIDADTAAESRFDAMKRLHLDTGTPYRVIATPASAAAIGPSIVAGTPVGLVRVALRASDDTTGLDRAGIGLACAPDALDQSWASALVALRLTSVREPVVDAGRLGAILLLADVADGVGEPGADATAVTALIRSQPRVEELMDAIAGTDSLRAVAQELGLHHSTVQARTAGLAEKLGFDIRSPRGRVRLTLALALHRLATNRFD